MKEELISCIVPVYNVEEYLNQCIESIVTQTYKNIEIILIDDGSTDASPEICDNWKRKDERIIVIHKKNEGVSVARNIGLGYKKGEWVVFIDSDDYLHSQYIEFLWKSAKGNGTLLSCCLYTSFYDIKNNNLDNKYTFLERENCVIEVRKNYYEMIENLIIMPWNKIYHSSLLEKFSFCEGKTCEDIGLVFFIIGKIKKVCKASYSLYYYRKNENGISETFLKGMKQMDMIDVIMKEYYFFLKEDEEYSRVILTTCIDFFPGLYYKLKENQTLDKKEFFMKYKEVYKVLCRRKDVKKQLICKHGLFISFPFLMDLKKENIKK